VTIINAYALALVDVNDEKEAVYDRLSSAISVPKNDKLLQVCGVNARVGKDISSWESVIGKHGIGKEDSNAGQQVQNNLDAS
jgi:hypothetical protein